MRSYRKLLCHLGAVLVLAGTSFPLSAQDEGSDPGRVWVFFVDKPPRLDSSRTMGVTERALQRRARRGDPAAVREAQPVHREYVEVLRRAGIEIRAESAWLNGVSAVLTPEQRRQVEALPFVRALQPVRRRRIEAPQPDERPGRRPESAPTLAADNTVYGPALTQLQTVNAIPVLEQGLNGSGVRIGFLDTDYDFTHPVFSRLVSEGRLLDVRDFTGETQSNRHGQYVASVAVGYDPGQLVGPCHGAEVLAATTEVGFFERNVEEDYFVAGMEWLEREGVDIVNVSLGYDIFDIGERCYGPEDMDGRTAIPSRAAAAAARLGVLVVAAAGNSGGRGATSIGSPADADSVITAGGVNSDRTRYSSSSQGPTADGRIKPDVAAQATSVYFASGSAGYRTGGGTSFAAPMVAGVACQMLQANPNLTPVQIRTLLRSTAHQAASPDNLLGWGIVDAEAAVGAALTLATEPQDAQGVDRQMLEIYPQPANRSVSIRSPLNGAPSVETRIEVVDLLGRPVLSIAVPPGAQAIQADVSGLPGGLYLVRHETPSGLHTGRILVSH